MNNKNQAVINFLISLGYYRTEDEVITIALEHLINEMAQGHLKSSEEIIIKTNEDLQNDIKIMKKEMN